ncbi:unnamed protein product, partial [Phaeothamnion confervicola]
AAFADVVLAPEPELRLHALVRAVHGARARNAPLRHVLLHGPPGTGKTMVARRIAAACGLDYAVLSGGDLGPLGAAAAAELHRLLIWARSSPRGLLLLLDEAEAALPDRRRRRPSEAARNALNALLHHTGEPSPSFMLVLATNRPGEIDGAVLDRVDELVGLVLPAADDRRRLCLLYYQACIADKQKEEQEWTPEERDDSGKLARAKNGRKGATAATAAAAVSAAAAPIEAVERTWRAAAAHVRRWWRGSAARGRLRVDPAFDSAAAAAALADRTAGMSGRDIEKIFLAVQAAVYGSDCCTLDAAVWEATTARKIGEFAGKKAIGASGAAARRRDTAAAGAAA